MVTFETILNKSGQRAVKNSGYVWDHFEQIRTTSGTEQWLRLRPFWTNQDNERYRTVVTFEPILNKSGQRAVQNSGYVWDHFEQIRTTSGTEQWLRLRPFWINQDNERYRTVVTFEVILNISGQRAVQNSGYVWGHFEQIRTTSGTKQWLRLRPFWINQDNERYRTVITFETILNKSGQRVVQNSGYVWDHFEQIRTTSGKEQWLRLRPFWTNQDNKRYRTVVTFETILNKSGQRAVKNSGYVWDHFEQIRTTSGTEQWLRLRPFWTNQDNER